MSYIIIIISVGVNNMQAKKKPYVLIHDERMLTLTIEPWSFETKDFEGLQYWNRNCWLSWDRALLREKAKSIKGGWIKKREAELEIIRELKVKNKY